ncbi:hypothetical protein [Candidatus Symbiopectobacterium sp. 'North America']|uniref:hypothetical protein n=1 Tax=Candidatus Symbiopectobacterium sp. 'North America' TaxID=2794574 RepID=UPI001FD0CE17|nr:hypothetical protein [Candidatus Symbiopectobacterium sp. 'North America']
MSNNLQLSVLLKAVDNATRPFKAVQTASKKLSGDIRDSQGQLKTLNAQAGRIEGFRKAKSQLSETGAALKQAQAKAAALLAELRNSENPTKQQAQALERAQRQAEALKTKYDVLRQSLQRQDSELKKAGISALDLSGAERKLRNDITQTKTALDQQHAALFRVSQQQEKLNAISKRYEKGKEITAGVRNSGAAAFAAGSAALYAESRLIVPAVEANGQGARIAAQTGGNSADGEQYTRVIKEINAAGVSGDLNQIAEAVAAVRSRLRALGMWAKPS